MEQNVGRLDQIIRMVAGFGLLVYGILAPSVSWAWAIPMFIIGSILIVTGIFRRCPIWSLLKINTNK